ncbi:hypothetical protein [Luteimicrobium subarcticum]|uniref:Uncharacterized protein n=1 Tax=Luteimicrobium subarcticum TaxID=620910 RepID=A0A2M8WTF0_9MICO|nr:hypothetical protein [Luteimicrobium subarcticum]PJI94159.1 hypothetical protein CLV34_1646 [Luteimicrobium subarcticum]
MNGHGDDGSFEEQQLPDAPGLRNVLASLASAAGDGGEALRTGVRTRVRRRRAVKAGATGAAACVVVGALVVGVAQASPWQRGPVVPAVTDSPTSTPTPTPSQSSTPSSSTPTHTTTSAPTHTQSETPAGPGDVVTATYDDGFVPYPFSADISQWDMWPYSPVADATAYTCGASEDVLQQATADGPVDVAVTGGLKSSPYQGEGGGEQTVLPVRVTDRSEGAFGGVHAVTIALVQGGRVVGYLGDDDNPAFTPGGAASVEVPVLTTNPRAYCTQAAWSRDDTGGATAWYVDPDAVQAAGTYRAYVLAEPTCPEATTTTCTAWLADTPAVASEPFVVTITKNGTMTVALDG